MFFKEQAECLAQQSSFKVGVVSISMLSGATFFKTFMALFLKIDQKQSNVRLLQRYMFSVPKLFKLTAILRNWYGKRVFKIYLRKYGRPDVIHLQTYEMGILARWIFAKHGIPYIVTEHLSHFNLKLYRSQEKLARKTFESSVANIAVSTDLQKKLEKRFNQRFHYVPNIVDTTFFSASSVDNGNTGFTFINIAHCFPVKQQQLLVEAFANVFSGNQDVSLVIGGDGPEFNAIKRRVAELNLSDQVRLTGSLSREEVKKELGKANAFVLCSKTETFGVVLIEAMASGLPCISTNSGGPSSIILNTKLGELCEDNIESLSEALEAVRRKEYNREYIKSFVKNNFSGKAFLERMLPHFENAIK